MRSFTQLKIATLKIFKSTVIVSSLVIGAVAFPSYLESYHCDQSWAAGEPSLMGGGSSNFVDATTGGTISVASSYDSSVDDTFTVTTYPASGYRTAIKVTGDSASGK